MSNLDIVLIIAIIVALIAISIGYLKTRPTKKSVVIPDTKRHDEETELFLKCYHNIIR